jgi:hypothetical protein
MPTVQEVLKESGFNDEQIAAMDQKAVAAFTNVLSTAEAAKQANIDFYDNQIAPSLVAWDAEKSRIENEKARLSAEAMFYKTQAEEAKKSGFIPNDAPGFQPRDAGGRYVAGPTGSPVFQPEEVIKRAGDGLAMIATIDWKYRSLFDGKPMPISPTQLIAQADARKMDPMTYAEQTFGFQRREQELQQERQAQHDNKIKQDAVAERDKYWAERTGNNPDIRAPQENVKITEIARAVRSGQRQDPLLMSETERRLQTRQAIREDIAAQQS